MRIRSLLIPCLMLAAPAFGQQPPPARPKPPDKVGEKPKPAADSLEAVIADALKNNPDIVAAQAKVREAENNLNKVRAEVMVAVAAQQDIVKQAKETFASAESIINQRRKLYKAGQLSELEMLAAETEYQRAKSELVKVEADLHKLVGRVPGLAMPGGVGVSDSVWSDRATVTEWSNRTINPPATWRSDVPVLFDYRGKSVYTPIPMAESLKWDLAGGGKAAGGSSMIEKIRAALDKPVKVDKPFHDVPVQDVLAYLRDAAAKDVPFRALIGTAGHPQQVPVSLMPGELPLAAWLIAIQDEASDLVFLVREYGILVTTRERAPKDAIPVAEFWRSSKAVKPKDEDKPKVGEKK